MLMMISILLYLLLTIFTAEASVADYPPFNTTLLDCGIRRVIYERAQVLQPWRDHVSTFDALELARLCGDSRPPRPSSASRSASPRFPITSVPEHTFYVPDQWRTIRDAIEASRRVSTAQTKTIILRGGIHYLNTTLELSETKDSNLIIMNAPGEEAWISGGKLLDPSIMHWVEEPNSGGVWMADLSNISGINSIDKVSGLFSVTPHRRFTRARFPNANAETAQWGYASEGRLNYSIPAAAVSAWTRPPAGGSVPLYRFVDLTSSPNPSGEVKNNSAMKGYNTWGVGSGGVCASVWGTGDSYWCGNASAGGWAQVDREAAAAGQLGIPIGVRYNKTHTTRYNCSFSDTHEGCETKALGPIIKKWQKEIDCYSASADNNSFTGVILHAWHSQSWAVHMFEIESLNSDDGVFTFSRGGQQGGRNWCRCDQCGYAGHGWCHPTSSSSTSSSRSTPNHTIDRRLISGTWYVEGIRAELDVGGEYFYNRTTKRLYFKPNGTTTSIDEFIDGDGGGSMSGIPALIVPILKTLVRIKGSSPSRPITNITIQGIGFRDSVATYTPDNPWGAPSGGDWALYKGGAIFIENAENTTLKNNHFRRLDGNAVFLAGYTRYVLIEKNEFSWIGDNAIATWGDTEDYDATGGNQPRHTTVCYNYIHELGIYEKQSSAWGQAKTCQSTLVGNIMFNMPRAAINFNDGMGGGNVVSNNLIWNTCRESGDHGPINSWNRMPFLTKVRDGMSKSFIPKPNLIEKNIIVANYGGSQGVDNDDGSSFYHIRNNIFYSADGFKMDYGGHDSEFMNNIIAIIPYDGANCVMINGGFFAGRADLYRNNTCVSGILEHSTPSGCGNPTCADPTRNVPDMDIVGGANECNAETHRAMAMIFEQNRYYTPHGNASLRCAGELIGMEVIQKEYGNEQGSSWYTLPPAEDVLTWVVEKIKAGW